MRLSHEDWLRLDTFVRAPIHGALDPSRTWITADPRLIALVQAMRTASGHTAEAAYDTDAAWRRVHPRLHR